MGSDHVEALRDAEPVMPEVLHDRAQDNWEPLCAIADAAGGDWPVKARQAALLLLQAVEEMDEAEVGVQLIHDAVAIMAAAQVDRVTTQVLLLRLHEMEERIWSAYGRAEKPISGQQVAHRLRQFGIRSRQLKIAIDGKLVNRHGFEREQFEHVLAQYPIYPATPLPTAETLDYSVNMGSREQTPPFTEKPAENLAGSGVAGNSGGQAETHTICTCGWCGEPLGALARGNRIYCSDSCKTRASQAVHGRGDGAVRGNGAEPGVVASVPFMITRAMREQLRARGRTEEQIRHMTPVAAHAELAEPPATPMRERENGVTKAQQAALRRFGVHPGVIAELDAAAATRLLNEPVVPLNALREPGEDLRKLAGCLAGAGLASAVVADRAQRHLAPGVAIDAAGVEAIKAGGAAGFAVRDALWIALS